MDVQRAVFVYLIITQTLIHSDMQQIPNMNPRSRLKIVFTAHSNLHCYSIISLVMSLPCEKKRGKRKEERGERKREEKKRRGEKRGEKREDRKEKNKIRKAVPLLYCRSLGLNLQTCEE